MNPGLPLLDLADSEAPLFQRRGAAVNRGHFAAAAAALAQRLPQAPYVLNLCEDRYLFSMVLGAAALRGHTALLPGSTAPAALQTLAAMYPQAARLSEDAQSDLPLTRENPAQALRQLAAIAPAQVVAMAFTSGSTGQPQPQLKTWHSLHHVGSALSQRFLDGLGRCCIVATVPPQHMYGLEASIMLPLVGGHSVATGRPVFPDDVRAALAEQAAPRVLVTTPMHIRALLLAATKLPPLACLISATAPLAPELAERAEQAFGTPLFEIYGCSEAGTIATRRTIEGELWQPIDGVRVEQAGGVSLVHGIHLAQAVPLQDVLEVDGDKFRLIGRAADMIKVAGRRASLADLTQKLLSITGVVDGVVFQPEAQDETALLQRPAALVVAPRLSEKEILHALGQLIDPVFLPRPLRKVEALPRNPLGKLPQQSLQTLLANA